MLFVAAYVAVQIIADILTLRINNICGVTTSVAVLIYPLTFTLRDMVHRHLGKAATRRLIVFCGVVNVVMVALFWLAAALPPEPTMGSQEEFGRVLLPAWRIVLASACAEVLAELLDTEAYALLVARMSRDRPWVRVLVSNAVSIPLDAALFNSMAFAGLMPLMTLVAMAGWSAVMTMVISLAAIPLAYVHRVRHG